MVDRRVNLFSARRTYQVLFAALGFVVLSIMLARPLLVHAAGGSIWSIVKSPNPSTKPISNDSLAGVTALSDTNAWAVGTFSTPSNATTAAYRSLVPGANRRKRLRVDQRGKVAPRNMSAV